MAAPTTAELMLDLVIMTDRLLQTCRRHVDYRSPRRSTDRRVDPTDSMDALTDDGSVTIQPHSNGAARAAQ